MIWKSDGRLDALLLNDPEFTVVNLGQFNGTKSKLSDPNACPSCKVTVENFTAATLTSQPAALAAAAVQRDPKLNWVWCYDFCMANVATDLIARGLQRDIRGAGFDCNAQNLGLINVGPNPYYLTFNPTGSVALVVDTNQPSGPSYISAINPVTSNVMTVSLGSGIETYQVAIAP